MMDKHKMLSLALLDLCAFAVTQTPEKSRKEAERNFKSAYWLAEESALPNVEDYRDFVERYTRR